MLGRIVVSRAEMEKAATMPPGWNWHNVQWWDVRQEQAPGWRQWWLNAKYAAGRHWLSTPLEGEMDHPRLANVDDILALKVRRILNGMRAAGFPMMVTDGLRTLEQQQALYAQGRTTPGKQVTNCDGVTTQSNHQRGRAVDCTFVDEDGKPRWSDDDPWDLYGAMARAVGLVWGGDWPRFRDRPHVELPKGE